MARFSISNAATAGFRLTRDHPKAILVWAGVHLVGSIVMFGLLIAVAGRALGQLMTTMTNPQNLNPQAMLGVYGQIAPAYLLCLVVMLAMYAVLSTAIYRAMLQPQAGGLGFLRLGAEEIRQFVLMIVMGVCWIVIAIVVEIGVIVVAGVVGFILSLAIKQAGFVIGAFLGGIGFVAAIGWIAARLSLNGPQTFAEGKLRFFDSWGLTKGQGWRVFGAFLFAAVLIFVVMILGETIIFSVSMATGGVAGMMKMLRPDFSSIGAFLTPAVLISAPIGAVLGALMTVLITAPAAAIYRDLVVADKDPAEVFA